MAGKVLNIKACSPLNRSKAKRMTEGNKQRSGLTGKHHAPESFRDCHNSYNLPFPVSIKGIDGYGKTE